MKPFHSFLSNQEHNAICKKKQRLSSKDKPTSEARRENLKKMVLKIPQHILRSNKNLTRLTLAWHTKSRVIGNNSKFVG